MNKIFKNRIRLLSAMKKSKVNYHLQNPSCDCFTCTAQKIVFENIISSIRKDEKGEFLSISSDEETKVSYAKDKDSKLDKRVKTTLARYIRRNLEVGVDTVSDRFLDVFTKKISQSLLDINKLEEKLVIVSGKEIISVYDELDVGSCMGGESSYKTELYAINPDKVQLVYFAESARALLWTCDDGTKVLDRIYPAGCFYVNILSQWAKKKGYVQRKNPDGAEFENQSDLNDDSVREVTLKYNEYFPYMDTFKFGKFNINKTVLLKNHNFNGSRLCCEASGEIPGNDLCCYECEEILDSDDAYHVLGHFYCYSCYHEHFVECFNCDKTIRNEDIFECSGNNYCEACYNKLFFTCQCCDEIVNRRFLVDTIDGKTCEECVNDYYFACDHCEEFINCKDGDAVKTAISDGKKVTICEACAKQNYNDCSECGKLFIKDNLSLIVGELYCKECIKIIELQRLQVDSIVAANYIDNEPDR